MFWLKKSNSQKFYLETVTALNSTLSKLGKIQLTESTVEMA